MELTRGICSLCLETTKVLPSADTEQFTSQLPEILYDKFLPAPEFQKIKHLIKVCAVCCYKIQLAVETHNLLKSEKDDDEIASVDACHFCKTDKCLMKIERNWKYFIDRTQGFLNPSDLPVCACPKCMFFFDTIFNFKTKLLYKFPRLLTQNKKTRETPQKLQTPHKQNDTPKRKSISTPPPSSKKRKIFDNCFTYLQPLSTNNYHIDNELKGDKRLFTKIAYVNLTNSKDVDLKETPKTRPVIKIKLKPRSRKFGRDNGKSETYIKLSKSEEIPKVEQKKAKRRYSDVDEKESSEEPEEKLDETPKSASASNLVPKRRVSAYMDNNGENEEKQESTEEETEEKENENKAEEEENVTDSVDHEEEPPSPAKTQKNVEVDENGVDESNEEVESTTNSAPKVPDDIVNGDILEKNLDAHENENEAELKVVDQYNISSDSSSSSSAKSASKGEDNSEGSDSDTNDLMDKNKDTDESDVLNGSERKKKRVTFSDEIN